MAREQATPARVRALIGRGDWQAFAHKRREGQMDVTGQIDHFARLRSPVALHKRDLFLAIFSAITRTTHPPHPPHAPLPALVGELVRPHDDPSRRLAARSAPSINQCQCGEQLASTAREKKHLHLQSIANQRGQHSIQLATNSRRLCTVVAIPSAPHASPSQPQYKPT